MEKFYFLFTLIFILSFSWGIIFSIYYKQKGHHSRKVVIDTLFTSHVLTTIFLTLLSYYTLEYQVKDSNLYLIIITHGFYAILLGTIPVCISCGITLNTRKIFHLFNKREVIKSIETKTLALKDLPDISNESEVKKFSISIGNKELDNYKVNPRNPLDYNDNMTTSQLRCCLFNLYKYHNHTRNQNISDKTSLQMIEIIEIIKVKLQ